MLPIDQANMVMTLDRRLLYGLLVPSGVIVIGGLIWSHYRRKSKRSKGALCHHWSSLFQMNRFDSIVRSISSSKCQFPIIVSAVLSARAGK